MLGAFDILQPIDFIQPGMQDMSTIICASILSAE